MSNLPVAYIVIFALAAVGVGLFIFNMCQAASGFRAMREIKRQGEEFDANMDELTSLQAKLEELKRLFFACSLSQAEKQEMWKAVDAALAPAITALLSDGAETGLESMRRAVAEAQSLVIDFANET